MEKKLNGVKKWHIATLTGKTHFVKGGKKRFVKKSPAL